MMMNDDRKDKAIIAIYDYSTRPGATAAKVRKALKKDGFTPAEIVTAVKAMENK